MFVSPYTGSDGCLGTCINNNMHTHIELLQSYWASTVNFLERKSCQAEVKLRCCQNNHSLFTVRVLACTTTVLAIIVCKASIFHQCVVQKCYMTMNDNNTIVWWCYINAFGLWLNAWLILWFTFWQWDNYGLWLYTAILGCIQCKIMIRINGAWCP